MSFEILRGNSPGWKSPVGGGGDSPDTGSKIALYSTEMNSKYFIFGAKGEK